MLSLHQLSCLETRFWSGNRLSAEVSPLASACYRPGLWIPGRALPTQVDGSLH